MSDEYYKRGTEKDPSSPSTNKLVVPNESISKDYLNYSSYFIEDKAIFGSYPHIVQSMIPQVSALVSKSSLMI